MLCFDRIDVSEGIDGNKTNESKEYYICHYWCFFKKGFKRQPHVCNGCYHLLMMSMNLSYIAVLSIKDANYYGILSGINKSETIILMQNNDLIEKGRTL